MFSALTPLVVGFALAELAFGVAGVVLVSYLNRNLGAAAKTATAPSPKYKAAA